MSTGNHLSVDCFLILASLIKPDIMSHGYLFPSPFCLQSASTRFTVEQSINKHLLEVSLGVNEANWLLVNYFSSSSSFILELPRLASEGGIETNSQ